jgi:hypothetical protein
MRYTIGVEQLEQAPSLAHRPDGVFRSARTTPGPTDVVDATTYGVTVHRLDVLDQLDRQAR